MNIVVELFQRLSQEHWLSMKNSAQAVTQQAVINTQIQQNGQQKI